MGLYAVFYHSKRDARHVADAISDPDVGDLLVVTPSRNDGSRARMDAVIWDAFKSGRLERADLSYSVLEYDPDVPGDLLRRFCSRMVLGSGGGIAASADGCMIDISCATPQEAVVAGVMSVIAGATVIKGEGSVRTTVQGPVDPIVLTRNQYELIRSVGKDGRFTNRDIESAGFAESTGADMSRSLRELNCVDVSTDSRSRPGRPVNVYTVNDTGRIAVLINGRYLPLSYRKGR